MNPILISIVAGTLLILLLVAGIVITFFYANRQRIQQEKNLAEAQLSFEKEIRQMESEVSENLMAQFANELHDNVGQLLTAMHIEIENQKFDLPDNGSNFNSLESYLAEITHQLRLLGKSLNTDFIGDSGLLAAIQIEIERLNSLRRFAIQLTVQGEKSNLEKDQELIVFRIFQEITQNALKHAKAKNLFVHLNLTDFSLEVKDDGAGFDYERIVTHKKASGLRNIVKRAKLANLDCLITSNVGQGTRYFFEKPKL
ncbi:MAG: ATP-binding protein [Crocinitomicaceae bacterium]